MAEEPEAASNRGDDDGDVIEPDESALGKVYKLARLLVALSNVDVIPANAATAIKRQRPVIVWTVRDYCHISRVVMADDRIVGASEVASPDINVNTLKKW